jgi:hypothetical protein
MPKCRGFYQYMTSKGDLPIAEWKVVL